MIEYNTYTLDKYLLMFDIGTSYKTYECESYYGIIFSVGDMTYDVIHNKLLGNRILINGIDGSWKDIPFKSETFWLLPENVKVIEI